MLTKEQREQEMIDRYSQELEELLRTSGSRIKKGETAPLPTDGSEGQFEKQAHEYFRPLANAFIDTLRREKLNQR